MKTKKQEKLNYKKPRFIKKKRYLLLKRQSYSVADFLATETP